MNPTTKLLAAALAVFPALAALEPEGTELSFSVEAGSTTTKTFTIETELILDDMVVVVNGEQPPDQGVEMTMTSKFEVEVTDEYVSMRDGVPKRLERTYDSIAGDTELLMSVAAGGMEQELSSPSSSELEGKQVNFSWNAETGEYDLSFPDEQTEAELLENLVEDMDLRDFLPDDEVAEGDEWSVDPEALLGLLVPGGDLKLTPEDAGEGDPMGLGQQDVGDLSDWFSEGIEGEVRATFKGTRDSDEGEKLGVIALVVEITNHRDMTEAAQEQLEKMDTPFGITDWKIESQEVETEFDAEGTLLWDLEGGHAHALELSGEFDLLVDVVVDLTMAAGEMSVETSMSFSGSLASTARIESQ